MPCRVLPIMNDLFLCFPLVSSLRLLALTHSLRFFFPDIVFPEFLGMCFGWFSERIEAEGKPSLPHSFPLLQYWFFSVLDRFSFFWLFFLGVTLSI